MDILKIEPTKYTPEIVLDPKGFITIKGKSYPENTFEFYQPVLEWLKNYFMLPDSNKLEVNLEIVYFNSSTSKLFFDFFDMLEEAHDNDKDITINWICDSENESAVEAGEDFAEDFETLVINIVEK